MLFGAPQLWVRAVLERHGGLRGDLNLSGGDLARRLLDGLGLHTVTVEAHDTLDHYDPEELAVRLTPDKLHGHSLTALTVAAHEVGHAWQHKDGWRPFTVRQSLAREVAKFQRFGPAVLLLAPIVFAVTRAPAATGVTLLLAFVFMGAPLAIHLLTLPVELDASFRRALPLLEKGRVFRPGDMGAARELLGAAALTYVAQAGWSMLRVWTWVRLLRR